MYKGKRILAVIPARGGSKGIPHKNIIELCGKPLICYTIEAAKNSKFIDYIMVSTDDDEIAAVAIRSGAEVPFMRPAELASDTSKTIDAVMHAIAGLSNIEEPFETLVLLQPTAPLRTANDIDEALKKYFECNCLPLVSVSEAENHPILLRSIENNMLMPILDGSSTCRRQDMPIFYRVNGCIYINPIDNINRETSFNDNIVPFIMEKNHSIDIDEMIDVVIAEYYMKLGKKD